MSSVRCPRGRWSSGRLRAMASKRLSMPGPTISRISCAILGRPLLTPISAPTPRGPGAARPACARARSRRRRQSGAARTRQAGRTRAVGHRARRACDVDPRARRHADRLPTRRLHARAAGRDRRCLRRRRRGGLSPLVHSAQARGLALRLRLLSGRAGAASHAHYVDVDRAPVSMEVVAGRQARRLLLDQRDAGATSRLVPAGPGAALRPVGNWRPPAPRRRAYLLR
jgi:hypothetical protein